MYCYHLGAVLTCLAVTLVSGMGQPARVSESKINRIGVNLSSRRVCSIDKSEHGFYCKRPAGLGVGGCSLSLFPLQVERGVHDRWMDG